MLEIALLERRPKDILTATQWKDRAFSRSWALMGPPLVKATEPDIKAIASQAYGIVVDVG